MLRKRVFLIFVVLIVLAFGLTFGFLLGFNKAGGSRNSRVLSDSSGKILVVNDHQVQIAEMEFCSDGQTWLKIGSQGVLVKVDSSGLVDWE